MPEEIFSRIVIDRDLDDSDVVPQPADGELPGGVDDERDAAVGHAALGHGQGAADEEVGGQARDLAQRRRHARAE